MSWTTRTSTGLRNVHEREVAAPPSEIWKLMTTFGTPADQVWPADRWPAMVLSDSPTVGSHGGHGPIRYRVDHVEDGTVLTFRFDPEAGITGWHGFHLAPTAAGTRVTHTAVIEHPSPLVRTVVVPLHDALIEDLLDQLEALVERRPLRRQPFPVGVQARLALLTAAQSARGSAGRRHALAAGTAATLGAIGALHLAWGLGAAWPARSREQLVQTVVGVPELSEPPGFAACAAVAGALGVAAAAVLTTTSRDDAVRTAGGLVTLTAAGVLALRGGYGLVSSAAFPSNVTPEYRPLDLAFYSPLCLALAAAMHRLARPPLHPRSERRRSPLTNTGARPSRAA